MENSPDKKSSLLKSSSIVSSMTMVSRVLGFVRDIIFARLFGAGLATDAFFLAFKLPNYFRRLFAEGAFSQAFVPVFNEYKEKQPAELRVLVANVAGTFAATLFLITTLGVTAAPLLTLVFAPGFVDEPEKYALATHMLRITFPYLCFISLTAFAGAVLNSFGRFAVPAFTPVLLNLCLIAAAIGATQWFDIPIVALAWGVFVAGLLQLLFQVPFLVQLGLLPRPRWGWQHPGVQKILKLMLPALFGSAVVQINLLLDTLLASLLQTGSISWLYYSDRLVEFPLGVFGVAIATVILPSLSQKHVTQSPQAFSATLDWALRFGLLICLPAMVGLIILAKPLLATLFQYGQFDAYATHMASLSLVAYATALPAFILIKILAPGFFARQDMVTPVRIGVVAVVSNIVFKAIIVLPMLHYEFHAPHVGLALSTALAAWVQAALLYKKLKHQAIYQPQVGWPRFLLKLSLAIIAMLVVLYGITAYQPFMMSWSYWQRGAMSALLVLAGVSVYFVGLLLMGIHINQFKRLH